MKVVVFIQPPKGEVIEKIRRHCGLWHRSSPRTRPPRTERPTKTFQTRKVIEWLKFGRHGASGVDHQGG